MKGVIGITYERIVKLSGELFGVYRIIDHAMANKNVGFAWYSFSN